MSKCMLCFKETEKIILCPLFRQSLCLECCFAISSGREGIIDELRVKYKFNKDLILTECDKCISTKPLPISKKDIKVTHKSVAAETSHTEQISPQESVVNGDSEIKEELKKDEKGKGDIEGTASISDENRNKIHEEEVKEEVKEEITESDANDKILDKDVELESDEKKDSKTEIDKVTEKEKIVPVVEEVQQDGNSKINILIVDGDQQTKDFFYENFKNEEYEIKWVSTSKDAIEETKKEFFNIIFVESSLPDGEGLTTIRKIKETNDKSYFIIMTKSPSLEIAMGAIEDHVNEYLAKPIEIKLLRDIIGKGLRKLKIMKPGTISSESEEQIKIETKKSKEVEDDVIKNFFQTSGKRYNIIREIGIGGFASVYKAWAVNLEKFVAVKKIHESFSKEAKFLDMFRDEAVNSSKLEQENIVRVIDFLKTENNIYYIIMEYVKGCNLWDLLKKCQEKSIKVPSYFTAHIVSEVLKALNYAHSKMDEITGEPLGIVHRDISPGNIMLYFDGRIKITDFGIAKAATRYIDKAKAGVLRGKVSYMSPEQAKGDVEIDHRSDIFSVGVVLYRLLTGQWLFEGTTHSDTWEKVKRCKIQIKPLKENEIPKELRSIVIKALHKDREKRYQYAEEMFMDLQKYLHGKKKYAHILRAEFKEFLQANLKKELGEEESSSKDESKFYSKIAIEQQVQPMFKVEPIKEEQQIILEKNIEIKGKSKEEQREEKPEEAREKTVFDFVLDTANKYKKMFISIGIGLLLSGIGFLAMDTFQHWTSFGVKSYNIFWPPTLRIDSVPSGANVSLKNNKGEDIGKKDVSTPYYISKILPGNYDLILEKEGFKAIERRITVFGLEKGKQDISIDGFSTKDKKKKLNLITIPFEIDLEINSIPEGADVYIDGKKLSGVTPLIQNVVMGSHTVKVVLDGFVDLGNIERNNVRGQCNLDFSKGPAEQDGIDRRYWDMTSSFVNKGMISYTLTGTFWKDVSIDSEPQGASIFVDDSKSPWGTTPQKISIKIGEYKLRLEKQDFESWSGIIKVVAESGVDIKPVLKKWVYFYSYEEGNLVKDINATVFVKDTLVTKKKTPFKYPLIPKKYEVIFDNNGYKKEIVEVDTNNEKIVKGVLKRKPVALTITVNDIETNKPIDKAYILLNGKWAGRTNEKGIWTTFLLPDDYEIKIGKQDSYEFLNIVKTLKKDDENINVPISLVPVSMSIDKFSKEAEGYYKAGDWEKAKKILDKLVQIDPENGIVKKYLEKVDKEIGIKRKETMDKKVEESYNNAKKYLKDKEWLNATEEFEKLLTILEPEKKSTINEVSKYIAYIDKVMNNIAQGIKPVDKSKDLFYALGFCYYKEGKFDRAEKEWRRFLSLDPKNEEITKFIKRARAGEKK